MNNGKQVFIAQLSYVDPLTGKRKFVRGFGETPELAVKRRAVNLVKRMSGPKTPRATGPTVRTVFDAWIAHYRDGDLSPETMRKYRRDVEVHTLPLIGGVKMSRLTQDRLTTLFKDELAAIGPSARWNAYKTLNVMFNWAKAQSSLPSITRNPLDDVQRPKRETVVREDDVKYIGKRAQVSIGLLKWLQDPANPHHDAYARILFQFVGLRRAELLGLEWSSVSNLNKKNKAYLTINRQLKRYEKSSGKIGWYIHKRTKSGKPRTVPLPERWRLALLDVQKQGRVAKEAWASDLIFLTPEGRHVDYNRQRADWNAALEAYWKKDDSAREIGKSDLWRMHANRHVSASLLYKTGIDLVMVQDILGHSDLDQTLWYTHTTEEKRREAMTTYGASFNAKN